MNNETLALAITKALAYTENGGKPKIGNLSAGGSGEMKSIFQFEPSTWKLYAKQELGDANAPLNNENETEVVHNKVTNWLKKGYNTEQIASMWNAGEKRPDAYKQNWKGTNSSGVSYDTPAYAKKVANYTQQFSKELQGVSTSNSNAPQSPQNAPQQAQQPQQGSSPFVDIVARIKQIMGGANQTAQVSKSQGLVPAPKATRMAIQKAS